MLLEILGEMHRRWPKDITVTNDFAYVSLLQTRCLWLWLCLSSMDYNFAYVSVWEARIVEESFGTARQLVAQSPGILAHRTTFALAAYRKNDPAAALRVYDGLKVRWERFPAGQRAVYAAVLGLNGKTAEARAEAQAVRWDELLPEERELIQHWRAP